MAVDKLVDSTQLDANLISIANAIRTKGGTSAQLAFPSEFVSAVNAIPTGSGSFIKHTGSFIPASDLTHYEVTELGAPAIIVICVIHDYSTDALDGVTKTLTCLYADGAYLLITTNGNGKSTAARIPSNYPDYFLSGRTVVADGSIASAGSVALATETGFSIPAWGGFPFRAGYTYDWTCYTFPEGV